MHACEDARDGVQRLSGHICEGHEQIEIVRLFAWLNSCHRAIMRRAMKAREIIAINLVCISVRACDVIGLAPPS